MRSSRQRTGRLRWRATAATVSSSRYRAIFCPKPPPTSGEMTVTCDSDSRSLPASVVR